MNWDYFVWGFSLGIMHTMLDKIGKRLLDKRKKRIYEMKLQNMKTKELAKWLHDSYEEIAKKKGWKTQNKCKVEFEDLPKENKSVMLSMARKIHKYI